MATLRLQLRKKETNEGRAQERAKYMRSGQCGGLGRSGGVGGVQLNIIELMSATNIEIVATVQYLG